MELFEVIKARRSVRAYRSSPVEEDKLQRILQSANQAPSAGNLQAYEIYLIKSHEMRQALRQAAYDQDFVAQAPVVLVFCAHEARSTGKYGQRGADLYCIQDASIACTFAMLAACGLGLATVWVGAFSESEVSRVLGLPPEHRPIAMLPIGYSADRPRDRGRRNLDDLVHVI